MLDLLECDVEDEEVDWISCFPESNTGLESLIFDCVECDVNFEALDALVTRSARLRKLRVNSTVSMEGLCRLMIHAPHLTHLGTGSFSLYDQSLINVDFPAVFEFCKSITCLSGFRSATPDLLPSILPVCSNLTTLNFSYANITADQLSPIISHCHNLHTLWVSNHHSTSA